MIGNARQRRSDKFRNQLSVFIICLVLSAFIWALVRLSKDYYYTVEYRLEYTQVPSHLKFTGCSDTTLRLRFRIQGFEFFSEHLLAPQERTIEVSLRNMKMRYDGDRARGYMLTGSIGKEIISQTSFPTDVYFVTPDTLFFEFERLNLRRIPARNTSGPVMIKIGGKDTLLHPVDTLPVKPRDPHIVIPINE